MPFRSLPEWMQWTIGVVTAILLALIVFLLFPAAPSAHPAEAVVRTVEIKSALVRLDAMLDRNLIDDSGPDVLEISVANNSGQPLQGLHLALDAPGFSVDQTNLSCGAGPSTASNQSLSPHQVCHFHLDLTPAARSGVYGITAFASWFEADVPQHATVHLAPITIDRPWSAAQWVRAFRRLGSFLKDITLPVILLFLGYFFTEKQKIRDNKQADREKEREARQEVERLLLERVMDLAKAHYLPFVGLARSILAEARKVYDRNPDADEKKLFLYVLLLLKRMENFKNTEGGVFFRRRGGERAVSAAWYLLKARINAAFGDEDTAKVIQLVAFDWDYAKFTAEFPNLDFIWKKFDPWVLADVNSTLPGGSLRHILGVLDAFQAVTAVEADYALKYWYDEKDLGVPEFQLPSPTVLYRSKSAIPLALTKIDQLEKELTALYHRNVTVEPLP